MWPACAPGSPMSRAGLFAAAFRTINDRLGSGYNTLLIPVVGHAASGGGFDVSPRSLVAIWLITRFMLRMAIERSNLSQLAVLTKLLQT
jgi:hypothetical protein